MSNSDKYQNFDDIKCLWMKCGAIDYKICDKNFDCDKCEFEKQMQNNINRKLNINEELNGILDPTHFTISFSHPNYHFQCNLVAKNFLGDNYYLGIEPFIAKFIDSKSVISYYSNDRIIKKNDPILNIRNGWGELNILSPFNFNYLEKLELGKTILCGKHWFSIIEAERVEVESSVINEKDYYRRIFELKKYLRESITGGENVGTTMYDGGSILVNWLDILGKSNYKYLLTRLFT